eukprot:scaffold26500_cov101-Isochrysis_galbana.AAC.2
MGRLARRAAGRAPALWGSASARGAPGCVSGRCAAQQPDRCWPGSSTGWRRSRPAPSPRAQAAHARRSFRSISARRPPRWPVASASRPVRLPYPCAAARPRGPPRLPERSSRHWNGSPGCGGARTRWRRGCRRPRPPRQAGATAG